MHLLMLASKRLAREVICFDFKIFAVMATDFLDLQIQTRMDPKAWLKRAIDERYDIVRRLYQIRQANSKKMAFFLPEYTPIVSALFKPFFPLPQARNSFDGAYFGHCLNNKRHGRGKSRLRLWTMQCYAIFRIFCQQSIFSPPH
jgi:hypothetical protein